LTATNSGTIAGWNIGAGGLSSATNSAAKITGNGLSIDASTNQATIGLTGSYPLLLTGGGAAASIQLGSGYSTKLNDLGVLTLAGAEFKYASSKFQFGGGASTIVCGRAEVGTGGFDCTGGGSFSGTVGVGGGNIVLDSSGAVTAVSFNSTSSRRFKTNIKDLTNGMDMIQKLRPVTFDWKNKDVTNDIGMIAEEVNELIPTIVNKDKDGNISGLEYGKLTAALIAAVKELSAELKEVKSQLLELKNK
jgi:hypothetical protein